MSFGKFVIHGGMVIWGLSVVFCSKGHYSLQVDLGIIWEA